MTGKNEIDLRLLTPKGISYDYEILNQSKNETYLFSFISIVRNGQTHLRECIDSIKNQNFKNYEVVFVDDNSNDDSLEILAQNIDTNWTLIRAQSNIGRAGARNLAVKYAKGAYLVVQDADDLSDENRLKYLNNIIEKAILPIDVIAGQIKLISETGKIGFTEKIPFNELELKSLLTRGEMPIAHPATCIKRSSFLVVGGYPDYARAQDLGLFMKLKDGNYYLDSKIHAYYRRKLFIPYETYKTSRICVNQIKYDYLGLSPQKVNFFTWILSETKRFTRSIVK